MLKSKITSPRVAMHLPDNTYEHVLVERIKSAHEAGRHHLAIRYQNTLNELRRISNHNTKCASLQRNA